MNFTDKVTNFCANRRAVRAELHRKRLSSADVGPATVAWPRTQNCTRLEADEGADRGPLDAAEGTGLTPTYGMRPRFPL